MNHPGNNLPGDARDNGGTRQREISLDQLLDLFLQQCDREIESSRSSLRLEERLQQLSAISGDAETRDDRRADPPPSRIGVYEILEPIRAGGMGEVFRARHTVLDCEVALKLLSPSRAAAPLAIERFKREMRMLAALNHPHVVRAYDAAACDGVLYLAMELVEGVDLRELARCRTLSVGECCELVRQAALGLEAMHQQGVIHRDVKPSNIMLTRQGTVKIVDLGLAMMWKEDSDLTARHATLGTENFMSPEQLLGDTEVDQRTDIYSLGRTLRYLLQSGSAPDEGRSRAEGRSPLPGGLVRLLDAMLAIDPRSRVATAREVARRLTPFCRPVHLAVSGSQPPADSPAAGLLPFWSDATPAPGAADLRVPRPIATAMRQPREMVKVLGGVTAVSGLVAAVWLLPIPRTSDRSLPDERARLAPAQRVAADSASSTRAQAAGSPDSPPAAAPQMAPPAAATRGRPPGDWPEQNPFRAELEREVAVWALSHYGTVTVNTIGIAGKGHRTQAVDELPDRPFVIQVLDLWYADVNDEDVGRLRGLRNLNGLYLSDEQLTDAFMDVLHPRWEMKWLYLQCPQLTDRALAVLQPYRHCLANLDLSRTSITDEGVASLSGFSVLREILLRQTAVTDELPPLLATFPSLVSVDLSETRVTDAGVKQLAKCTRLRKLYLSQTAVTDAVLSDLKALPLEILELLGTRVTPEAAARFRDEHPRCAVKY